MTTIECRGYGCPSCEPLAVGDIIDVPWDERPIRIKEIYQDNRGDDQVVLEVQCEDGKWLDWGRFYSTEDLTQIMRQRRKT